ncbi:MAG: ATP-binding protein [Hahellaceae bacterium]|nr:ATP-binding protein [Hahellaceae bacterium]
MAFSLSSLTAPETRATHFTLVGEAGLGKTSAAATWPKPVFIRTEDGMAAIAGQDVKAFPVCKTVDDVMEQIAVLARESHNFQTLVIDSVTQLNTLIEKEVIESDPKKPKSIAQACGGYGAGYKAMAERHRQIRERCDWLNDKKGMHIVYIAHADVETIDQPDQDSYSRYTLRLHKNSISHYVDNVDCVAYLKLQTYTSGDGNRKKATTTGERIITCYPVPSHVSKNRFGITEDLILEKGVNPFLEFVPSLKTNQLKKEVKSNAA